jgi:hypothetical protein
MASSVTRRPSSGSKRSSEKAKPKSLKQMTKEDPYYLHTFVIRKIEVLTQPSGPEQRQKLKIYLYDNHFKKNIERNGIRRVERGFILTSIDSLIGCENVYIAAGAEIISRVKKAPCCLTRKLNGNWVLDLCDDEC